MNLQRNFAILAALAWLASCAVNPVTGERQLALISESQEIEIGQQVAAQAEQQFGLVDDEALQQYFRELGERMARASERPDLPWHFGVADDPTPNAFAAPGGYIYITRGLLALLRNEAELVSVLGHEIGHVTARHSVAMISRAQLAELGLGLGAILSPTVAQFGQLAGAGLQILFLSYSRDAERQADDLGYRYALEQGYDVREMVNVFAALSRSAELAGHSPAPSWLASHPYPEDRIRRIERHLEDLPPAETPRRVGEDEYLARIEGLAFGPNPRNGFFEEDRFFHPELEFQIDFPQGWRTQNTARAVLAGSPQEDAMMQLTLAEGSVQDAANVFFAQQGLTSGGVRPQTINGLNAIVGAFEAQTQQGQLGGVAAFIAHGGRTYQVLGITPAQQRAHYDRTFRSSLGTFARLTDPAALERQPNRIAIVRLRRAMSVAEFNENYPSEIPLDQLALINQLAGPEDVMPAGFQAKRVISQ
jgi:predicted Zn-dependent protease